MLCACCSSASSLEIRTGIFCKSVTLWTALQIPLWSKPHLVFRHKVYEIALSEVLATQIGVTEAQYQSQLVWVVQIWPIFASQPVDSVQWLVKTAFTENSRLRRTSEWPSAWHGAHACAKLRHTLFVLVLMYCVSFDRSTTQTNGSFLTHERLKRAIILNGATVINY